MLLLTTCAAEKIYLGLPFSLALHSPPPVPHSLSARASSIFILWVSLSPFRSLSRSPILSFSLCVTRSMALIHQLVLRADNGLCHIAKGKERHRDRQNEKEKKRARLRLGVRKMRVTHTHSHRERRVVGGGGGVSMGAVSENVETLHLLWTSQWEQRSGGHRLLYKIRGVTPTLCWLLIPMSVWLCWTLEPLSLVSLPFQHRKYGFTTFPSCHLCSYLRLQAFYSAQIHTQLSWKAAKASSGNRAGVVMVFYFYILP